MLIQPSNLIKIRKSAVRQHLGKTEVPARGGGDSRMAVPHIDEIHASDRGNHLRVGIFLQLENLGTLVHIVVFIRPVKERPNLAVKHIDVKEEQFRLLFIN